MRMIFVFSLVMFVSCNNTLYDAVFRTMDDPFQEAPSVESFVKENTVYLSWRLDEAADEYVLMRSVDGMKLQFKCVYRGNGTSYTDVDLQNGGRYVYRLDKTRGKKYFAGEKYGYGLSSNCRKDFLEPNDVEESATFLEYDLICNLPCVQYAADKKLILDEDWFYVKIPPMRTAGIIVRQDNLENPHNDKETKMCFQLNGMESRVIKQNIEIPITNSSFEERAFYFKIFPESTNLFNYGSSYTVIEYTVSLAHIYNYSF